MKSLHTLINPDTLVLLKRIATGVAVLSIAAAIVYGVRYVAHLPALQITEVQVSGGKTLSYDLVRRQVELVLEGEYMRLIPRRFVWLYPEDEVLTIVSQIERVHNVSVQREGTALAVTFDEYVPFALWCAADNSASCLFLDQTGYAFATAPQLTGGTFLRFVRTDETPTIGQTVVDGAVLQRALALVELLKLQNWFISYVELDHTGDIFLQVVGGGELKVSATEEPVTVVDNFLTILASDQFSHLAPGNFQYVDLRFGNKVYVNEETATSTSDVTVVNE